MKRLSCEHHHCSATGAIMFAVTSGDYTGTRTIEILCGRHAGMS